VALMWFWAALLGFGGVLASFSPAPAVIVLVVAVLAALSLLVVRAPTRGPRAGRRVRAGSP